MKNIFDDRLDRILADSESILNRVNERLDRIDKRQKKMEDTLKAIDGIAYLINWKSEKEGVK